MHYVAAGVRKFSPYHPVKIDPIENTEGASHYVVALRTSHPGKLVMFLDDMVGPQMSYDAQSGFSTIRTYAFGQSFRCEWHGGTTHGEVEIRHGFVNAG